MDQECGGDAGQADSTLVPSTDLNVGGIEDVGSEHNRVSTGPAEENDVAGIESRDEELWLAVDVFQVVLLAAVLGDRGTKFQVDGGSGEGDDHAGNPHDQRESDTPRQGENGAGGRKDTRTNDTVANQEDGASDANLALLLPRMLDAAWVAQEVSIITLLGQREHIAAVFGLRNPVPGRDLSHTNILAISREATVLNLLRRCGPPKGILFSDRRGSAGEVGHFGRRTGGHIWQTHELLPRPFRMLFYYKERYEKTLPSLSSIESSRLQDSGVSMRAGSITQSDAIATDTDQRRPRSTTAAGQFFSFSHRNYQSCPFRDL